MGCGSSSEANPVTPHPGRGYQPKAPGQPIPSSPVKSTSNGPQKPGKVASGINSMLGIKPCSTPVQHRSVDLQVRVFARRRFGADTGPAHWTEWGDWVDGGSFGLAPHPEAGRWPLNAPSSGALPPFS
jgi:hypothetical protein